MTRLKTQFTARMPATKRTIEAAAVVAEVRALIDEHYVFSEVGSVVSALLAKRLADGSYDGLDAEALAATVTTDLQEGTGVAPDVAVPAEDALDTALALARR